jgi:hypothetical protein
VTPGRREIDRGPRGECPSAAVLFEGEAPARTVLLCDLEDGRRALVASRDPALAGVAMREELCGRRLRLAAGGEVSLA